VGARLVRPGLGYCVEAEEVMVVVAAVGEVVVEAEELVVVESERRVVAA
jgi:hypothetical protein